MKTGSVDWHLPSFPLLEQSWLVIWIWHLVFYLSSHLWFSRTVNNMTKVRSYSEMFTGSGSVYWAVTLCREPYDKSFSNHLITQVHLITNFMQWLRVRAGKVSKDNTTSRLQVLRICPRSKLHQSVISTSSRVTGVPSAFNLKHWLLASIVSVLAYLETIGNTTK